MRILKEESSYEQIPFNLLKEMLNWQITEIY